MKTNLVLAQSQALRRSFCVALSNHETIVSRQHPRRIQTKSQYVVAQTPYRQCWKNCVGSRTCQVSQQVRLFQQGPTDISQILIVGPEHCLSSVRLILNLQTINLEAATNSNQKVPRNSYDRTKLRVNHEYI